MLLLHGVIENGTIFHSPTDAGLAPYLAKNGFNVFVSDFRGRGRSEPPVGPRSSYGQTEEIVIDIPILLRHVRERHGVPAHCIAHSWGGVLLLASLRRHPDLVPLVRTITLFGTKRTVRVRSFGRFVNIDLLWNIWGRVLVAWHGYLPKGSFGKNTDAESNKTHLHCKKWIKEDAWVDPDDGFDYGAAALERQLPAILSFAGRGDAYLGHPADVERFLQETGAERIESVVLGLAQGFKRDYDHVNMLTAREAPGDHFPILLNWLRKSHGS